MLVPLDYYRRKLYLLNGVLTGIFSLPLHYKKRGMVGAKAYRVMPQTRLNCGMSPELFIQELFYMFAIPAFRMDEICV
jgi:hypothetical protein